MKKKRDKIDQLLATYEQAAAKRITRKKKEEERIQAEKKARELFEANLRKKITDVFRPVMQQLISRMDKELFGSTVIRLESASKEIGEYYTVQSKKEKEVTIAISLEETEESNEVLLSYSYSLAEYQEEINNRLYKVEDIDAQLIEDCFISCLKKICI